MTQPTLFTHGYALLIGVEDSQVARLRLPDVTKDVKALAEVLTHPDRCAYPTANIKVIQGSEATRKGILAGLTWLRERIATDSDATAVLFYSGHGHRDDSGGEPVYALIPYDVDDQQIELSALAASDFARAVEALRPKRLLVVLDCCHAGGMGAKDLDNALTALPAKLFATSAAKSIDGAKSIDNAALQQGQGRAVLSSSQGSERSYMRLDGKMSLFTYHLIEALTGHAQPEGGAPEVLVSDVLSHVSRQVPAAASAMDRDQHPDALIQGNFPIALVLGGKGLAKGIAAPDPLAPIGAPPAAPTQTTNTGERGVAIGGNVTGSNIVTGNENVIGSHNQVTKIDTGGAAYIGGNVRAGRDVIGRDKIVHGDDVAGDKVGGDKITVSGVNNSNLAVGRGASVNVNQGMQAAELAKMFADLYRQIEARHDDLAEDRDELRETVKRIEQELQKKESANPEKMKRWLTTLSDVAPDIFKAVTQILTNPVAQVSGAIVNLARSLRT